MAQDKLDKGKVKLKNPCEKKRKEKKRKEKKRKEKKRKENIAAPEFRIWSPTTLLGQALSSLTTVDRTGNGAFC